MKILHISPAYFDPESVLGGGERFFTELAKRMARYAEVRMVSFGPQASEIRYADNLSLKVYPSREPNPMSRVHGGMIWDIGWADVVHCHQYHVWSTNMAIPAARLLGKKVFVTDCGGWGRNISRFVDLTRFCSGLLLLSRYSCEFWASLKGKKTIIYGGYDPECFKPDPGIRRESKFVYVGRILPHKGLEYAIEALPAEAALVLIGPAYRPDYRDYLRSLCGSKDVHFVERAGDREVVKHYQTASAAIQVSVEKSDRTGECLNGQLFSLATIEAMACACPVIVTQMQAMTEIVEDGVTGFRVPMNDSKVLREKMGWILRHPFEAQRIGDQGYQFVSSRFTWDHVVHRCLDAYQQYTP